MLYYIVIIKYKIEEKVRIISPFHDYYDVGLSLGTDQTLQYIRTPIETNEYKFPSASWRSHSGIKHDKGFKEIITHIVGFCGKIYPILEITALNDKKTFCITLQDVSKFVEANYREKEIDDYYHRNEGGYKGWGLRHWDYNQRECFIKLFFEHCEKYNNEEVKFVKELFREHRCPVFVATDTGDINTRKTVYNGCLKNVQFFRYFDPYTAFQEIYMWISNQAVPFKPIPEISDKVMAEAKGFDKYSFRKDKSK